MREYVYCQQRQKVPDVPQILSIKLKLKHLPDRGVGRGLRGRDEKHILQDIIEK